jgi:hypothetical protein
MAPIVAMAPTIVGVLSGAAALAGGLINANKQKQVQQQATQQQQVVYQQGQQQQALQQMQTTQMAAMQNAAASLQAQQIQQQSVSRAQLLQQIQAPPPQVNPQNLAQLSTISTSPLGDTSTANTARDKLLGN